MTGRTVDTWVGSSPDARIPARVKLRIFQREGGKCHLSGRKIMPGDAYDFDHKVALCNGGTHSEDNLFPALRDKHRQKTASDVAIKAKTERMAKKHLGLMPTKRPWPSRGFNGKPTAKSLRQSTGEGK